jgi:hypothetical protein
MADSAAVAAKTRTATENMTRMVRAIPKCLIGRG